jgi:hypothetical protein
MNETLTYSDKLKDPRWQKKRLEVFQRDGFKCTKCGEDELTLHVHHLKYNKQSWDAPLEDLATLCESCHSIIESFKKTKLEVLKITMFDDNANSRKIAFIKTNDNGFFIANIIAGKVVFDYAVHVDDILNFLKS